MEGNEKSSKGLGNDFQDMTPKAQITKIKIDKCDCTKLKNVFTVRETAE